MRYLYCGETVAQNLCYFCDFQKATQNTKAVNNRPISENSPRLATLVGIDEKPVVNV
jgi:hypothetical protein